MSSKEGSVSGNVTPCLETPLQPDQPAKLLYIKSGQKKALIARSHSVLLISPSKKLHEQVTILY